MNLLILLLRILFGTWPHQQTQMKPVPVQRGGRSVLSSDEEPHEWVISWLWLPIVGWLTFRFVSEPGKTSEPGRYIGFWANDGPDRANRLGPGETDP